MYSFNRETHTVHQNGEGVRFYNNPFDNCQIGCAAQGQVIFNSGKAEALLYINEFRATAAKRLMVVDLPHRQGLLDVVRSIFNPNEIIFETPYRNTTGSAMIMMLLDTDAVRRPENQPGYRPPSAAAVAQEVRQNIEVAAIEDDDDYEDTDVEGYEEEKAAEQAIAAATTNTVPRPQNITSEVTIEERPVKTRSVRQKDGVVFRLGDMIETPSGVYPIIHISYEVPVTLTLENPPGVSRRYKNSVMLKNAVKA